MPATMAPERKPHRIHSRPEPETPPAALSDVIRKSYLTTGQVARFLDVAVRTVKIWCDTGELDHYKLPGSWDRRITPESLRDFLTRAKLPQLARMTRQLVLFITQDFLLVDQVSTFSGLPWERTASFTVAGRHIALQNPCAIVVDTSTNGMARDEALQIPKLASTCLTDRPYFVAIIDDQDEHHRDFSDCGYDRIFVAPADAAKLADHLRKHTAPRPSVSIPDPPSRRVKGVKTDDD